MAIARYLDRHPKVERVRYPGLPADRYRQPAKQQMRNYGGIEDVDDLIHALDDALAQV